MIAEWEKQEIPLGIVLAAISEVAPISEDLASKIESIASLQERIQQGYLDWLQTRTAADGRDRAYMPDGIGDSMLASEIKCRPRG
jgi:hypothetical protein